MKKEGIQKVRDALAKFFDVFDADLSTFSKYSVEAGKAIAILDQALARDEKPLYFGLTRDHLWISCDKKYYDRLSPEMRMEVYLHPPEDLLPT